MALSQKAKILAGGSAVGLALLAAGLAVSWRAQSVAEAPAAATADAGPALSAAEALKVEAQEMIPTAPENLPPPPEDSAFAAPKITTWFVAEDGAATIAGEAAPAALVTLTLNDAPLAQVVATGGGEFAALAQIPPNPAPSVLKIAMELPTGERVTSDVIVVIGPVADLGAQAVEEMATASGGAEAQALPADFDGVLAAEAAADLATGIASDGAQALALSVSPEGVALLGLAADPAGLRLGLISYPSPERVAIQGQAPAESLVRLYLDNALRREIKADALGAWAMEFDDIAAGLYALRLDALDGAGVVVARVEMPFQRETIAALAALSAPLASEDALITAAADDAAQALGDAGFEEVVTGQADAAAQAITPVDRLTRGVADLAPLDETAHTETASGESVTITVQPGHSLWAIARDQFGDGVLYVQVYEANKDTIRDPNLIYPGQVFVLPKP